MSGRRITTEVEVDLDDFDDDEIYREAAARGVGLDRADRVSDLARAIVLGQTAEAHQLLLDVIGDNPTLRSAAELGRRRLR